jgi:hypothetical protein
MGVIAEGLADMEPAIKQNISIILLDTMGVYWTMKYENHKEAEFLKPYNMRPKSFDILIYTPKKFYEKYREQGIPTDFPFSLKPSELDITDWCLALDIKLSEPQGVLLEKCIAKLREDELNYSIDDLIKTAELALEVIRVAAKTPTKVH